MPFAGTALVKPDFTPVICDAFGTTRSITAAPEQPWRIDQLTDGTYRLMPKAVPNSEESLVLSAVGSSMPTLARFNPESDRQRWNLRTP